VYISSDGQNLMPNLMPLTDIATGVGSLTLCGFPIPDGNYKLFVQAKESQAWRTRSLGL
jgi:hypothetical protein